ncbi:Toxin HigB-2 [compost metagenome]
MSPKLDFGNTSFERVVRGDMFGRRVAKSGKLRHVLALQIDCSNIRQCRIVGSMFTIIETEIFKRYAESIWDDGERHEFITWLAANPLAGDVVPGSGGLRKVRWSRSGIGKRGGTRVIYYNTLSEGSIWLLIAYTKAKFDNLPAAFLKQLKEEISNGQ